MPENIQFNRDFREHIQLINGSQIKLRLIQPTDKQKMVKAFELLSSKSRRQRFFGAKDALTPQELRYFTEIDQFNHYAIVAMLLDVNSEEVGVAGIARFIRFPTDPKCAEVGITLIDSEQGKGIGCCLLERLFTAAIERGVERLRFECLSENHDMQRLIKRLSKHVKFERENEVLIAEFVIPNKNDQYPTDFIEDLNKLIRKLSSEALLSYANFNFAMYKQVINVASEYSKKNDKRLLTPFSSDKTD